MSNYFPSSLEGALDDHVVRIRRLEASLSGGGVCGAWQTPTFVNSWANAGAPFCDVAYRLCGTTLEFMGHCTGGASGTVAFYLDADYWPSCDLSTATDVITPSTPGVAQIYVAAADGAVTITEI